MRSRGDDDGGQRQGDGRDKRDAAEREHRYLLSLEGDDWAGQPIPMVEGRGGPFKRESGVGGSACWGTRTIRPQADPAPNWNRPPLSGAGSIAACLAALLLHRR